MDAELKNSSSPQNHLEMMEMMMQLKPAQFSRPYQDIYDSSDEFSSGSAATIETPPPNMFHNPYLSTSAPSMSLIMRNPIQESTSAHPSYSINVFTSSCTNGGNNSMQKIKSSSSMEAMREMIFRIAMMQPIHIDPESVKPPKRKNVKISKDPQSVAARHRRERISERIRILQRLVPGGTKMDTASMLDEAVHYVKFLKKQVQSLEQQANSNYSRPMMIAGFPTTMSSSLSAMNYSGMVKASQPATHMMVGSMQMLS